MPKSYTDRLLADREQIIYVTRQHWFVFLTSILVEVIISVILIGVVVGLTIAFPVLIAWITLVFALVLLLIPFIGGVRDFLNWWNRQYIVTNRRVIQIAGVINKNITDSSLEKVNDVKMVQSAWGRMFNFGDIEILTASEMGANIFQRIGDPIRFKTAMLNAKEVLERGIQTGAKQTGEPDDIPGLIAKLDELRQKGILSEAEFQIKKTELLKKIQ